MFVHVLGGCAPYPLAHYLKALAVLRLVAEGPDPRARAWWRGERYLLATRLAEEEIEVFFAKEYAPSPIIAPWNKGSGFYYVDDPGLTPVERSTAPRFEKLREAIAQAREVIPELIAADRAVREIKDETKKKGLSKAEREALKNDQAYKMRLAEAQRRFESLKAGLLPRLRLQWRGALRQWLDTAMVLDEEGEPLYPALLGTGGNDGRLDFTNNFLQRIAEVFELSSEDGRLKPGAHAWLANSLWGRPMHDLLQGRAVGQFLPGAGGGANSVAGPDGDGLLNPFDFILMMEGVLLFAAHLTRRFSIHEEARAAAPFAVGSHAVGYLSAADSDEDARGEQWMPLWSQPLSLFELRRLLSEGRAQIGAKPVRHPVDFARAAATLGCARGISAFQRYGYFERKGQSKLAVPLGRFLVPERVIPHLRCLQDIAAWVDRLHRQANANQVPGRLRQAQKTVAEAAISVSQHPTEKNRWQELLLSLSEAEAALRESLGQRIGPLPPLRPEWVPAADDGSPEFRLAVACALQVGGYSKEDDKRYDGVRRHWLPLEGGKFAVSSSGGERIRFGPEVVITGKRGLDDAIALVRRRLVEAGQKGERRLPLAAARGAAAYPGDLARLLAGEVDLDRTMKLACALMALDGRKWAARPLPPAPPSDGQADSPEEAWMVIRLAMAPWPLPNENEVGVDPVILRRLETGDAAAALRTAARRLLKAGIVAALRFVFASPETARLWAAALAFPIDRKTASLFIRRIDPRSLKEESA
ncbi:MAG: type I-U CRISPR-associated protein Csx17 [Desulfobacterales bacterium]